MTKNYGTLKHTVWLPYNFAVGPVFLRFYEGLKEGKILGNQCSKCKKTLVPARTFCPSCYVDMGDWREVSQEGNIVSWIVANEPFLGMPIDPPFIAALIRLDGTDCSFLHLVGGFDTDTLNKKIKKGTRVRAHWCTEKKGHLMDIQYFKPT